MCNDIPKGIVHTINSVIFAHPLVFTNLYDFLSAVEHNILKNVGYQSVRFLKNVDKELQSMT